MNYKLYTDKINNFSCNVQVKGASVSKSKARMIVETKDMSYIFNGTIDKNGKCNISIPKTKSFINEVEQGRMKLEIVADDLLFEPWNSDFIIKDSKNVKVKINESSEQKTEVEVIITENKEIESETEERFYSKEELSKILKENLSSFNS